MYFYSLLRSLSLFILFSSLFCLNSKKLFKLKDAKKEKIIKMLHQDDLLATRNLRDLASSDVLVVSIGGACLSALELYRLGLRTAAYPFDVIVSELDGLIKAIKTNFAYFLDGNSLTRRIFKNVPTLYNSYYQFTFPHDLSLPSFVLNTDKVELYSDLSEFKKFQEKYRRRINRFNSLAKYKGKVFFLRTFTPHTKADTKEKLVQLRNAIRKKFPQLNFEIVVVNVSNKISQMVQLQPIENIRFFLIKHYELFSLKTDNDFMKIFTNLSISVKQGNQGNFLAVN